MPEIIDKDTLERIELRILKLEKRELKENNSVDIGIQNAIRDIIKEEVDKVND